MEYTYQQKIALMRIMFDIIHADGIIHERETFFFDVLKKEFDLLDEDREEIYKKNPLLALTQLRAMTLEQKEYFAQLMSKMIIVDDDININEVAIYDVVRDFCLIPTTFEENISSKNL